MRKQVLVVEDDNPIQHLLVDILEEAAYGVQTVRLGREAVSKAKATTPDLILLDLMLPDLDGNGVLDLLAHDTRLKKIPVIVLSAYPQLLRRTPQVRAVVAKPFDIVELLNAVEEHTTVAYRKVSTTFGERNIHQGPQVLWTK